MFLHVPRSPLGQKLKKYESKVYSFEEALKLGAANPCNADPPKPSDVSTIMYTSGTTG